MKLELKHLAPYLPYGLKYIDKDSKKLETMRSISTEINLIDMGWGNAHDLKEFKPILRPLSDLTEEYVSKKTIEDYKFCSSIDITKCLTYHSLTYLLSLHFDVFGLIEKGLAIDINTL